MAGYTIPGPLCINNSEEIDSGTNCLHRTPTPGPIGVDTPPHRSHSKAPPSKAYLFIISDELLPSGKLIRKITVAPDSIASEAFVKNPEIFGLQPRNPTANVSIGEHALGNNKSPFISASTKKGGAPNFNGKPYYIDIEKIKAAGVKIHSTDEIIIDLQRLASANPSLRYRVDKLIKVIKDIEGEVLLEPKINVPASVIKSPLSMNLTRSLRGIQFIGFVFSAYDLTQASKESFETHSINPIVKESIRQTGGWGGAFVGMRIGGVAGAAVGIESGPGALVTGAVGALIFGIAGFFSADWLSDWLVSDTL